MNFNFLALALASFSTLFVGFIWYHPKVFGTIWMRESGTTEEKINKSNMVLLFVASLFYAFLISFVIQFLVIHQTGAYAATVDIKDVDPSVAENYFKAFGETYRTFQHGALHGFMSGLFLVLPVIGTNALYERRSFKYVLINGGFWIVCFTIMGGIICAMK